MKRNKLLVAIALLGLSVTAIADDGWTKAEKDNVAKFVQIYREGQQLTALHDRMLESSVVDPALHKQLQDIPSMDSEEIELAASKLCNIAFQESYDYLTQWDKSNYRKSEILSERSQVLNLCDAYKRTLVFYNKNDLK